MRKQEIKNKIMLIKSFHIYPSGKRDWREVRDRILLELEKELNLITPEQYLIHFKKKVKYD